MYISLLMSLLFIFRLFICIFVCLFVCLMQTEIEDMSQNTVYEMCTHILSTLTVQLQAIPEM